MPAILPVCQFIYDNVYETVENNGIFTISRGSLSLFFLLMLTKQANFYMHIPLLWIYHLCEPEYLYFSRPIWCSFFCPLLAIENMVFSDS